MTEILASPQLAGIVIGPAGAGDADWCARLMVSTDPWLTLGRDLAACRASVGRPGGELFLARAGDDPLGFLLLHPQGLAGSPYVALVAVTARARGRGIGSRLLDFAHARYPDARHIFLCVTSFNVGARALYERHGYRVVGELKDHSGPGFSELLMQKTLE